MLISVLAVWLIFAVASAIVVTIDLVAYRQRRWSMNILWPVTALGMGLFGAWGYFRFGRAE